MKRLWLWLKLFWHNLVEMKDPEPVPKSPTVDAWQTFEQERREEFERALKAQSD